MIKTVLALLILLTSSVALQSPPQEIPVFQGDDNPSHDGQPKWCQNGDGGGYKANCKCERDCNDPNQDQHRQSGCRTYCRTPACHCDHGCPKTEAM